MLFSFLIFSLEHASQRPRYILPLLLWMSLPQHFRPLFYHLPHSTLDENTYTPILKLLKYNLNAQHFVFHPNHLLSMFNWHLLPMKLLCQQWHYFSDPARSLSLKASVKWKFERADKISLKCLFYSYFNCLLPLLSLSRNIKSSGISGVINLKTRC